MRKNLEKVFVEITGFFARSQKVYRKKPHINNVSGGAK
jgi:hypothetical protein